MPVEMIGWVTPQIESEILPDAKPAFDHGAIERAARIHEEADFDRALFGYFSNGPDTFLVAAHAAAVTTRLGLLLAHRPGFVAPTLAARKFATLDQLSRGRTAMHLIAGGSDADQAKDGDFMVHDSRYRRMAEYVDVMKKVWGAHTPFDFDGEFYRVVQAESVINCYQQPCIPLFGGGGSPAAIAALAPRIDVFMLWGEPLGATADFMHRVRAAAGPDNQSRIGFSVSTRPILGATDEKAWQRAERMLDKLTTMHGNQPIRKPENVGSQRLIEFAERADVHDSCLWTKLAAATGAHGNTTALVGSAETVAQALFAYYKLGASRLLIRGFEPLEDAQDYGRELIPRVRELVAAHDKEQS